MLVFQKNHEPVRTLTGTLDGPAVILADPGEGDQARKLAGLGDSPGFPEAEADSIRFESRDTFDYLSVHIPAFQQDEDPQEIECLLSRNLLVVVGEGPVFGKLRLCLESASCSPEVPAQVLASLFNFLLAEESGLLDRLDDTIEDLEDLATSRKPADHSLEISSIRKDLSAVKRYYEALYDLLSELEDNHNGHLTRNQLQVIRAQRNKANRMVSRTLSLREHLTQVREAFQNQLDISLNETMRFFTVITAVFLPLTLIAGWYGMNLRMPELESALTYPIIIGVSLGFLVISLVFCKKKGWF